MITFTAAFFCFCYFEAALPKNDHGRVVKVVVCKLVGRKNQRIFVCDRQRIAWHGGGGEGGGEEKEEGE